MKNLTQLLGRLKKRMQATRRVGVCVAGLGPAMCGLAAEGAPTTPAPATHFSRVFWTGHSLVDRPIPDYFAGIANSLGRKLEWDRQYIVGSSIRARTRGKDGKGSGYREGIDIDGDLVDVLKEFDKPKRVSGRYDTLLITEQHSLLETMVWNDPVRHLRHFHDRFIERNPNGTTFFYHSWFGVDNKDAPRRWIAHERMAAPIWECLATRINVSLAHESRADRIQFLPVGAAFADLAERTLDTAELPDIRQATPRATMDLLFTDDVHVTRLGAYYAALATYALASGSSPVGAWAPEGVTPQQAQQLQTHAGQFAQRWRATHRPLTVAQCRQEMLGKFAKEHWAYMDAAYWSQSEGGFRAKTQQMRLKTTLWWRLWRNGPNNPMYFDPQVDKNYWFSDF